MLTIQHWRRLFIQVYFFIHVMLFQNPKLLFDRKFDISRLIQHIDIFDRIIDTINHCKVSCISNC